MQRLPALEPLQKAEYHKDQTGETLMALKAKFCLLARYSAGSQRSKGSTVSTPSLWDEYNRRFHKCPSDAPENACVLSLHHQLHPLLQNPIAQIKCPAPNLKTTVAYMHATRNGPRGPAGLGIPFAVDRMQNLVEILGQPFAEMLIWIPKFKNVA